jgi:hypothetical protein
VFLKSYGKELPKCKVAHSIRQSYLYGRRSYLYEETRNEPDIYDKISTKYPLKQYRVQQGNAVTHYHIKNDLIAYYLPSMFKVIPVYDYVKNDYEYILSFFSYDYWLKKHHYVCVVRAPNRREYLLGTGRTSIIIANTGKGPPLIEYKFNKDKAYLFHSMPIANSFVLTITRTRKELVIDVFDLIEEKSYVQTYSIENIVEAMLSQLEGNDKYYEELKSIVNEGKLRFKVNATSSIDTKNDNLVFYNKYVVNITISFKNAGKTFENVLSIFAVYDNYELTVRLQINGKAELKISRHRHEIDFGSSIVLKSDKYKVDNKYDISQSHLYSVIASAGDYTIISEPTMSCKDKYCNAFVLYYKGERSYVFKDSDFSISSFGNIMFILFHNIHNEIFYDKTLAFINKNWSKNVKEANKYYVIDGSSSYLKMIDIDFLKGLVLDRTRNNNANWVGMDITDKVIELNLGDKLTEMVRRFDCPSGDCRFFRKFYYVDPNGDYQFYNALYYIDKDAGEFYSLVYFRTSKKVSPTAVKTKAYRMYLLKAKIEDLLGRKARFRLIWKFKGNVRNHIVNTILHHPERIMRGDCRKLLRLLSNKWNTGNGFTDLKVFNMCGKGEVYHDYRYNRISIKKMPKGEYVLCNLHLVRRIV